MSSSRSYPSRPFMGVSALICHGGRFVLVQRAKAPMKGVWTLPGGAVETGERLEEAIAREVHEETGLHFKPERLADLVEIIREDDTGQCERHFIIAVFTGNLDHQSERPPLKPGDDASNARWIHFNELEGYDLTEGTGDVIARILSSSQLPAGFLPTQC